jgi:hypothetical protein
MIPVSLLISHKEGDQYTVDAYTTDTVLNLKEKINNIRGINPNHIKLIIDGVRMENDKPLSDYGVTNGKKILLSIVSTLTLRNTRKARKNRKTRRIHNTRNTRKSKK